MGQACIKAYHEMEERYARLVLQYFSTDQRNNICDTVGDMIKDFGIAPSVTVTPGKDLGGEYSVEFHDDYDRESHKFFEKLIKTLGIDHCEVEI
jgi:hypothetical protein